MRYIIILFLFSSCITQKEFRQLCQDKYIIKDSIIYYDRYDTIYEKLKGDTIIFWDNKFIHDTTIVKKIKHINKYTEKIIYRENVANLLTCRDSIKMYNEKYKKLDVAYNKDKISLMKYRYAAFAIFIVFAILILFNILLSKIKIWK